MSVPAEPPAGVRLESPDCSLCGGGGFAVVHAGCADVLCRVPGRFDVVRCTRCGLRQTRPRPDRATIGAYYPAGYGAYAPGRPQGLARRLAGRAWTEAARIPPTLRYGRVTPYPAPPREGARLLDVGCGSGGYLAAMRRRGWEVWGLEPDEGAARAARALAGVGAERVPAARAEDAELPEGAFDLVTLSHVLEHLHDPLGVLRKARAWLRPGGALRVWVPNAGSLEARVFGRCWLGLDVPRHLTHFTRATVAAALEQAGFEVVRAVPQLTSASLAGSILLRLGASRGFAPPAALGHALLPLAGLLQALGEAPMLDVAARRA